MKKLNIEGNSIVAHEDANRKTFDDLKREFERAYAHGDYGVELTELANIVALSVLNKLIDPQRYKHAEKRTDYSERCAENVAEFRIVEMRGTNASDTCNSGFNPAMVAIKRGLQSDLRDLANLADCDRRCAHISFNHDGDMVEIVDDKNAMDALTALSGECLSDGIDLRQTAVVALLEMAEKYANGGEWLDAPILIHRIKRKVLIKESDTVAYEEVQSAPIREVYRAVRRYVQESRAVATDPRNGYTYIEEMTEDGLDTVYLRMGKYADIGGADCHGLYTAGREAARTYSDILHALKLTDRQTRIVELRTRGYGCTAIASYLGVTPRCIEITFERLRAKCEKIGFTPEMWSEMTAE